MSRPTSLGDFKRLGAKKMGISPVRAKVIHDERKKNDMRREVGLADWVRRRHFDFDSKPPATIHTLPLPRLEDRPAIPAEHSRKRNWESTQPSIYPTRVHEINNGRYSSRCTYTHYTYCHEIECWGAIVGRYLYYRINTANGVRSGTVKAFRGWAWKLDANGICMARGKADYHPEASDLLLGITPSEMASRGRENRDRRIAADKAARQQKRLDEQNKRHMERAVKTLRVTLDDARRAGNCLAGTMRFCKDRLGVVVSRSNPYQSVSASELLATGDPSATRAVYAAYQRETTVSI